MAFTNIHPAPGLADLMPGFYVVPQNPITLAQTGMGYFPKMGELLPSSFTVPQNPIVKNFQSGMQGMGTMGCAPGSNCGAGFTGALAGLGEDAVNSVVLDPTAILPSTWDSSTMWIIGIGAVVLLMSWRPGSSAKQQELKRLRQSYERGVAEVKGKYKTVGSRVAAGGRAATAKLRELSETRQTPTSLQVF